MIRGAREEENGGEGESERKETAREEAPARSSVGQRRRARRGSGGELGSGELDPINQSDQLAIKDPVDLDSGIDYGVVERVVREDELRPQPDNTWDPPFERAKFFLKLESGKKVKALDAIEEVLVTYAFRESLNSLLRKCITNLLRKFIRII
ncbi:hypothetical protein Syun_020587 [Stephania yunnanensis]|uniref:Uncharacterized protein n=1 Tax=Stephania yunnanensis TaxID=152371 RepID=A0AAP0IER9_9MAGN